MKNLSTFPRSWLVVAAIAASGVLATAAALAADQPAKPQNSAKLAKPLKDAHDDLNAKKYPEAIAKLKEAEGIAGKTAYDQHLINDMLAYAYIRTNNLPDAAKAWEAELEDGFTTPAEQQQKVRGLAEVHYQVKNYDKAIEYGQRAIKGGYADDELKKLVGQAYYLKGDWKGTLKFEEGTVDAAITPNGHSLYAQTGATGTVDEFHINNDGSLTAIGHVLVPDAIGGEGIVAL